MDASFAVNTRNFYAPCASPEECFASWKCIESPLADSSGPRMWRKTSAKAVKQTLAAKVGISRFKDSYWRIVTACSCEIMDDDILAEQLRGSSWSWNSGRLMLKKASKMSSASRNNDLRALEELLKCPRTPNEPGDDGTLASCCADGTRRTCRAFSWCRSSDESARLFRVYTLVSRRGGQSRHCPPSREWCSERSSEQLWCDTLVCCSCRRPSWDYPLPGRSWCSQRSGKKRWCTALICCSCRRPSRSFSTLSASWSKLVQPKKVQHPWWLQFKKAIWT